MVTGNWLLITHIPHLRRKLNAFAHLRSSTAMKNFIFSVAAKLILGSVISYRLSVLKSTDTRYPIID